MTRTLLVLAASLLIAPAAWAISPPVQEGGGDNVNGYFKSKSAPSPAPSVSHASAQQMPQQRMQPFNISSYRTAADCMTAASAAHQPLGQCEALKK